MGRRSALSAHHPVLWVRTQELSADPVPWSDSRYGFKALQRVQYHRTCNACWPARKPVGSYAVVAQPSFQFHGSRREEGFGLRNGGKWLKRRGRIFKILR